MTHIRSPEELQRIERCLHPVIWVSVSTAGIYFFALSSASSTLIRSLIAATAVAQVIVVYRLGLALKMSKPLLIGRCLLCVIPTICLISLVAMISDGKEVLRRRM